MRKVIMQSGRNRTKLLIFVSTVALCVLPASGEDKDPSTKLPPAATRQVDFAADVQPLLARHCYSCHSAAKQESNFRLDHKQTAFAGGDLGEQPILPGMSGDSPLVRYIAGADKNLVMPPRGPRLTAEEVGLVRAWIDQGASWPAMGDPAPRLTTRHWSFQPLMRQPIPAVNHPHAGDNPLDAFIVHKLQAAGFSPAPAADRVTFIRRLSFDMLGLPPTLDELQAFVADQKANAYEALVERVLASPRYGERWARHWLDVVRFAETNGFETNFERPNAWRYRDYVIEAFNSDKPYSQFVFEQLAGDAVGVDDATGFLVGGPWDKVKSPDSVLTAMQRADELADITNTTATTFLGLTIGCARCHNHKFDPILQKDYYALQAVFAGVEHGERPLNRPRSAEQQLAIDQTEQRLAAVRQEFETLRPQDQAGQPLRPPVNSRENVETFPPLEARYVRFTSFATNSGLEPCLDELQIFSAATVGETPRNVALGTASVKLTSSGVYVGNPFHKLEHLNDGKFGNSFSWISNTNGAGWVQVELAETTPIDRIVWGRDRDERYQDRTPTRYTIEAAVEPGKWQIVATSNDRQPTSAQASDPYLSLAGLPPAAFARGKALVDERKQLDERLKLLTAQQITYAGRFVTPGPTHRLFRGDPLQLREVVAPDCLTVLGSLALPANVSEQERRVALAKWIVDPSHPLTARVIVNRVWQHHFGMGLVDTPSDLGVNGARPSHPELLDWLAIRLIDEGWSLKKLHRLILLSNTYRQSSQPTAAGLQADAQCRLVWRYPPHRLEAEAIRDTILATSGGLDLRMGGPGWSAFLPNSNYVRVYDPKEEFAPGDFRRAIYMLKVRMRQDGVFGAFDCPDAGQIAPKRARSTTPLQALSLFNSQFILQQAEWFAARIERESEETVDERIKRAFQLAFGRLPATDEASAARQLVEQHGLAALCRALFNANEFLFIP